MQASDSDVKSIDPVENPVEASNGGLFISPGYGYHRTRVIDSYELILVTDGVLELFEESNSWCLYPGQTLLLFPGKQHGSISQYPPDLRFYWVHFRVRQVSEEPMSVRSPVHIPKFATLSNTDRVSELFHRFLSDQKDQTLTDAIADRIITLILCEIARQCGQIGATSPLSKLSPSGSDELVQRIRRHIENYYGGLLSASIIAERLTYNPDYLERLYRSVFGEGITRSIQRQRISVACELLRERRSMNIEEIALSCGFRYPSYFHRVFRKFTGLTPKQFRALYRRIHINTH